MSTEAKELASLLLRKQINTSVNLVHGVISEIEANGRVAIYLQGSDLPFGSVRCFEQYVPSVGDAVWIVKNGPDLMVLGRLSNVSLPDTKYLARGFYDEQVDNTNRDMTSVGAIVYASGTHIDIVNNDDHDRRFLLRATGGFTGLSGATLCRFYPARVSPFDSGSEQEQFRTDGAGAAFAIAFNAHDDIVVPAGSTYSYETIGMRVSGGTGTINTARLSAYDMGGIPPS